MLHDFRTGPAAPNERPLRIVQWNIERGYKLPGIIEELKRLDADIIGLQEIDINCERSGNVDTGKAIAEALQCNYAFVCEFEELHSPVRNARTQGGGVHGNAILTKFDMTDIRAIEHSHHPIDWEKPDRYQVARREPRKGCRYFLAATISTRQGPIVCYSAHLEVFCGMSDRVRQFADILRDARQMNVVHQCICGDINTMANGVARLSPNYCRDTMRWRSIGKSEAEVWAEQVFSVNDVPGAEPNPFWLKLGVPESDCRDLLNPGFHDPWDAKVDITLDNPTWRLMGLHLMKGKLDWLLCRNMDIVSHTMGNDEYEHSDHKWLAVEVNLRDPSAPPPLTLAPAPTAELLEGPDTLPTSSLNPLSPTTPGMALRAPPATPAPSLLDPFGASQRFTGMRAQLARLWASFRSVDATPNNTPAASQRFDPRVPTGPSLGRAVAAALTGEQEPVAVEVQQCVSAAFSNVLSRYGVVSSSTATDAVSARASQSASQELASQPATEMPGAAAGELQ